MKLRHPSFEEDEYIENDNDGHGWFLRGGKGENYGSVGFNFENKSAKWLLQLHEYKEPEKRELTWEQIEKCLNFADPIKIEQEQMNMETGVTKIVTHVYDQQKIKEELGFKE